MQKGKKAPKASKNKDTKNKGMYVVIAILGVLLVVAAGVILCLVLSSDDSKNDSKVADERPSTSAGKNEGSNSSAQKDEYGKYNPIIMITDRNTPVIPSEEEGVFTQTAEVNMYCDLQDGYEISGTTGKAYKGSKAVQSQMEFENTQNYRKYSQYGSVALICTGHGKYRKSDKWELTHHYLKVDYDNITDDGRFTFTEEAWLNPDGSTKEFRDFAPKLLRITSSEGTLEKYYVKMHFILNREAQDFLSDWQKLINTK